MKKFDFSIYKDTTQYFAMFDVLIKKHAVNKDHFLLDHNIVPSSYRRCRNSEQKAGSSIINKLCKVLKLKPMTNEEIDELENFADKVYYYMTYKIYKTYEEDINYINSLLNENSILFPILKLLLLFLNMNANKSGKVIISENKELYLEIMKYQEFYTDELLEICELAKIFFEGENKEQVYLRTYNNAIAYTILSYQSSYKKDYVASLYFAYKAKEIAEREGNIKRIIYLNNTIMMNLLFVGNYDECNELASRQKLILQSLDITGTEMNLVNKFLTVSYLGLEKYKSVIKMFDEHKNLTLTEFSCFVMAAFKLYRKNFDNFVEDRIDNINTPAYIIEYLRNLRLFLKKPDKNKLLKLEHPEIMSALKLFYKKMLKPEINEQTI